ncbi:MAG TPA: hypothetical protein VMI31_17885 [Fimbriimonadaceae bacterium]|nr:hypothetical protein [Fimbriimonadaceae bacterium]
MAIIRRKPAAWWHFVLWNTESSELTSGAWHKGSCYPEGADISPDGTLLAVSFGYGWGRGVAAVPDLNWVLRWDSEINRIEAGAFSSASEFLIDLRGRDLLVQDRGFPAVRDTPIDVLDYRLRRDGWTERMGGGYRFSPSGGGPAIDMLPLMKRDKVYRFPFQLEDVPEDINDSIFWACYDSLGQLLLAREGRVELHKSGGFDPMRPSFVRDLNDLTRPKDYQFSLFPLT